MYSVCIRIEWRADVFRRFKYIHRRRRNHINERTFFIMEKKQSRIQPKNYMHFISHTHKKTYPSISCCVCSFIYLYATNVFVYIECYFETDSFTWTCQSMCILNHRKHDDNDDHDQAQSMNFAYFLFLLGYRRRKKMNNIEGYK